MTLGLACAQFLTRDLVPGVPLTRGIAAALVIGGVFLGLVGARRYQLAYDRIEASRFEPANRSAIVATVLMVFVGALAVAFILLLRH